MSNQNGVFDASKMHEILITNMMMKHTNSLLDGNFELSLKNIGGLILLLSSNEIKSGVTYLFTYLLKFFKKYPIILFKSIFELLKFKKPVKEIQNDIKSTHRILELEVGQVFMELLHTYIKQYGTSNIKSSSLIVKNSKEIIKSENHNHIKFKYKNTEIKVYNQINYEINIINNKVIRSYCGYTFDSDINDYTELSIFTREQATVINNIYNEYIDSKNPKDTVLEYYKNNIDDNKKSLYFFANELQKKYKNLNVYITCIKMIIFYLLLDGIKFDEIVNIYNNKKINIFDLTCEYSPKNMNIDIQIIGGSNGLFTLIQSKYVDKLDNFKGLNSLINNIIKTEKFIFPNDEKANTSTLTFFVPLETDMQLVIDFTTDLYKTFSRPSGKIKINILTLEYKKTITSIPNPAYKQWSEKMKFAKELNKDSKDISEIMKIVGDMPIEFLDKEEISKNIVVNQLNETFKDVNALYLRKEDKENLLSSLIDFRDKKEKLLENGMQDKLNILLHGAPGTGKSTAILWIASYLQKDIYYMDLRNAKTNNDLQTMFEYVNKNVPNSGIIVIEDIDAQTDKVKQRIGNNEIKEVGIANLLEEKENGVTLEYLLNILQGTLTMDGSIFIVTTNYFESLDKAFVRDGRFDFVTELKLCDHHQIRTIYKKMLEVDIDEEVLKKIPEDSFTPAKIMYHLRKYFYRKDITCYDIMAKFITN